MRRVLIAIVIAAALPTSAHAAWPGVNGRISLTQRVPAGPNNQPRANRDIWAYARDGERVRVTTSTDNEEQSSWSPDGRWVAYKRREAVYVATWDGAGQRPLTTPNDGDVNNTQPAWSPDMRTIVFRTNRALAPLNVADIWVMDAPTATSPGGTNQRPLIERPGDERYPVFSPDGTRIAFRGDDDGLAPSGDEEIFVAAADGTGIVQLTDDATLDSAPAWSPDGTRIAFESARDGERRELYVMDADGTDEVRLTHNDVHDEGPAWSPDGRMIAFTRAAEPDAPGDTYVMNADGSGEQPLTQTPVIEESPDWQPLPVIFAGEPLDRDACGDRSLLAGGVASIVTVRTPCAQALRVADRWLAGTSAGRPPRTIGGFRCGAALHSFDQELVQCDHRGRRKGAAFVHRRS
jgi:Tol biopolymer transport system component